MAAGTRGKLLRVVGKWFTPVEYGFFKHRLGELQSEDVGTVDIKVLFGKIRSCQAKIEGESRDAL